MDSTPPQPVFPDISDLPGAAAATPAAIPAEAPVSDEVVTDEAVTDDLEFGGYAEAAEAADAAEPAGSAEPAALPRPAGADHRRGLLKPGDQVQLTDPKGRHHTITLQPGKQFHTHKGAFDHDELIGSPEGIVVKTGGGTEYLVLRPLLSDYVLSMPRGAAVVYPKDAGQIVQMADVFPGARVVEAGVGSGALTCSLLRAVGDAGTVHSYERREDFAEIAGKNIRQFFGAEHPAWRLTIGDLAEKLEDRDVDRVILDMLAPWDCVDAVFDALVPGGVVCCYVATTTQLSRTAETLRSHGGFTEPAAWESMVRTWHLEGLAVRPDHRMIAHTGFLITARRLADGVTAPVRRRRPSKGAYAADYAAEGATAAADGLEPDGDFHDDGTVTSGVQGSGARLPRVRRSLP